MGKTRAVLAFLVGAIGGCSQVDAGSSESLGVATQALTSSDVLGFESTSGWSTSAGTLSASSQASEGSAALALTASGYTTLTSATLSSLASVGDQLTLDVRLSQAVGWGEVRLVAKIPSLGEHWRDLGGQALSSLSPNSFHQLQFAVPPDLKTKLSSTYSDLSFAITLNAAPGVYTFDRLSAGGGPRPPALHNTKYAFNLVLPSGVNVGDVVVGASHQLTLGDRTRVTNGPVDARVFSATGNTEVGAEAFIGGLVSGGDASLRSYATVSGDIRVGGSITKQNNVTISGAQLAQQTIATHTVGWVERPSRATTSITLGTGVSRVITPGTYASVVVSSGATLYLAPGKYFFDSVQIEPQADVVLQETSGPTLLFVKDSFVYRGRIRGLGAHIPDLMVGYVGTGTVVLESAFPGSFVAPNGTLRLQPAPTGGHAGTFYAKSLTVEPNARVSYRRFAWETLIPPDLSNAPVRVMTPSPVVLVGSRDYGPDTSTPGSADPAAPVTFEIPRLIPVTGGNAGNGTAILTFDDQNGAHVTCTYRGRSSTAHPATPLELARGLYYVFEACSNNLGAGDEARGTDFTLTVNGDSESGSTTAEIALGKGTCSGLLEPLITPEQSIEMATSFSWANTTALPETDAEGYPALYYANIYIRNEEERKLLKRFFIHHQAKPVFVDELRTYEGKCGSFQHGGDGVGQFVYAVIPGKTYNRIRAATTHPDIPADQRLLFQAIVLRQAPAAAVHPNGALRYGPLKESGFYYMNLRDMPPREALSEELLGSSDPISALVDSIEFVVEVAYEVGTGVVRVLGVLDRWIFGRVNVTVDLEVLNRDPAFEKTRPMHYGYGTQLDADGNPLSLGIGGMQVEILQWAWRPLGVYPTNYYAHTGSSGVASLDVGKSHGNLAGDALVRGSSGICIEMKNYAAEFISGLLPNEICDFRNTPEFNGFESDSQVVVQTDDYDAHALAQSTEAYDYIAFGGHFPRRARVLTGHTAAVVSEELKSGRRRLWTPCLGYSGNTFSMVQMISSGIVPLKRIIIDGEIDEGLAATFGAPWYMGRLAESDIVMPRNSSADHTRAIMVHEYGHFIACSLMDQQDPDSLGILTLDVIFDGASLDADDEARYMTEAFADFITGQVVGAANYFTPANSSNSGSCDYCNGSGTCLDENFRGSGSGEEQIKRVATLYQDAFDGASTRGTLPTNGDAFSLQPSPTSEACTHGDCLRAATAAYGNAMDEQVTLPIDAFPVWFFHWYTEANLVNALRESPVMKGLGTTMRDYGFNWCQQCEVFANHSALASGGSMQDKFQACLQAPISDYLPDDPPEASGRIRAADCRVCPAGTISAPDGTCTACGPGEQVLGNVCSPCTAGQIVSAAGVCTDCPSQSIVVNNTCMACDTDEAPDAARTACVVCPVDVTLDWRTVPDTCQEYVVLSQSASTSSTDICPERFFINVTNLNDVFGNNPTSAGVGINVVSDAASAAACATTSSHVDIGPLSAGGLTILSSNDDSGSWSTLVNNCLHQDNRPLATAAEITAGTTTRGLMVRASTGTASASTLVGLGSIGTPFRCEPR